MQESLNYYQKFIGSANINIKQAIAGCLINCVLTCTVGETGINDGGSLKILFRISADVPDVQFSKSDGNNYVKITSSNKQAILKGFSRKNGAKGKIHERPWTNGFTIFVSGNHLFPQEKIYIEFKKWRIQTFSENSFEFKFVVDPFSTGKYIELNNNPTIRILSGKPAKLVVITPTTTLINKAFNVSVKLEDEWGNPCNNLNALVNINLNSNFTNLPKSVNLRRGTVKFKTNLKNEGYHHIKANYKGLTTISNPIIVIEGNEKNYYWADLHGQAEETVGTNSFEDYIEFAKKYGNLDVICFQPNDFEVSNAYWKKINTLAKSKTVNNEFVLFPGYEWSGNSAKGGDRNVLYQDSDNPIYRSSHALVPEISDINSDCTTVKELFKKLYGKKTLTIAHVGGRCANLAIHDDSVEKAVEVHSNWGTFEWFLFDALEKNYKVGIVANSDTHNGRPGASYPGLEDVFNAYGGLTCILADRLEKKSIFNSILKRHLYATTGARIYLNTSYFVKNNLIGMMGDEIKPGIKPNNILLKANGTSFIEKVELFNKSKIIGSDYFFNQFDTSKNIAIKITWSGCTFNKGKDKICKWKGVVSFVNNEIENVEKVQIYDKNAISIKKNKIIIDTHTSGNLQGVIIMLKNEGGKCEIKINGKSQIFNLNSINSKEKNIFLNSEFHKLTINTTLSEDKPNFISKTYTLSKKNLEKDNAIFFKVTQRDGHMAWTSPIYFQL